LYLSDEAGQPVCQFVTGHHVQAGSGKIQEMNTFDSKELVGGCQFGACLLDLFRGEDIGSTSGDNDYLDAVATGAMTRDNSAAPEDFIIWMRCDY
jgi:hypothetical protein